MRDVCRCKSIPFRTHRVYIYRCRFDQCDNEDLRYYVAHSLCLKAAAAGNRAVSVMPHLHMASPSVQPFPFPSSTPASLNITAAELAQLNLPPEDVQTLAAAGELMKGAHSEEPFDCSSWLVDDSDMEEMFNASAWI